MERLTETQARRRKKGEESLRKVPRESREQPGETPTPPGARDDARCRPTLRPPGTDRDVISRQSSQERGRREGRGGRGRHVSWTAQHWGNLGPDRQTRSPETEREGHMDKIIQTDRATQRDTARDTVILTTHGDTTRKDCP